MAACGAPPAALREASRVDRLRAQITKAQNAIAENGGGLHGVEEAAACVTILGR